MFILAETAYFTSRQVVYTGRNDVFLLADNVMGEGRIFLQDIFIGRSNTFFLANQDVPLGAPAYHCGRRLFH